ncbi:hypothetical protein EON66_03535 [archaeon]|nr:MAG: hypothetical protein EON66_03535 [archaeon]
MHLCAATGLRLPPFGAHLLISKQTPPIVHGDLSGTLAGSKLGATSEQAGTLRTASATAGVSSARGGTCALGKSRNISASQITFNSIDDRFDYTNVINPDRKYPAYTWCSVTESEHFAGAGEKGEFRGTYKLASNGMTSAESTRAAYRARWTNDTEPAIRDARFTTEAVRTLSTSAPEALRPCAQRFLPGTCKALETLREKAQAALGLNAVWMVARTLPTRFNLAQLKRGLETLGVTLSVDEGKDVWKQWDAEATGTTTRDIAMISLLTHTVSTLRVEAVDTLWLVLTRICHADKVRAV